MSKQPFRRSGAVLVAFALGVVVGSAGLAAAAFGKKGWERFGTMFKQGYVAGFVDCLRIAKAMEPYSYLATQFPVPLKAKPIHWMTAIDELYKKKEHENRPVAQMMVIAGHVLEKQFGPEPEPAAGGLEQLREAIEKQRRALLKQKETLGAAKKEVDAVKPGGDTAKPDGDTAKPDGDTAKPDGEAAKTAGDAAKANAAAEAKTAADKAKGAGGEEKPPVPETSKPKLPEGSHSRGMLPEGSHPDSPIKHPQADPNAPNEPEGEQ